MSTLHTKSGMAGFLIVLQVVRQQFFFLSIGKEFHRRGPATEKMLSPYRLRDGDIQIVVRG